MSALKEGSKLQNGKYIIEKVLGQGGFGITYLAQYPLMNEKVAIKELFISGFCVRNTINSGVTLQSMPPEDYSKFKQRFIDEAKILHNLRSPYLVWVQDIFEENDTVYFTMDYIEGITLRELISQRGKLGENFALNYILQISEALKNVHSKKLLHRDIKPENIIITKENNAVLIDFGNARTFSDGKSIVQSAFITPGYAPIEQYHIKEHRGFYIDIYALGATLYNCLTGQKPIPSIERYENPEIEKIEGVSDRVYKTIVKAMALKYADRYQTVDEFMNSLINSDDLEDDNTKTNTKTKTNTNTATNNTTTNTIYPEMVYIQGGTFLMGSNDGKNDEKPIHRVTLSDFYMGKYEVTNEQFCAFLNDYGSDIVKSGTYSGKSMIYKHRWGIKKRANTWKPASGYAKYPVIKVTWYGAYEYCNWLSQKTGQTYRLPSEAEWEYAARGGVQTRQGVSLKYAGSNNLNDVAWYWENSGGKTHQVGTKSPNSLGLYDMSGNVWEWCSDWYDSNYYSSSPTNNPTGASSGSYRVLRGGSWISDANYCRVANRLNNHPTNSFNSIGFRMARSL